MTRVIRVAALLATVAAMSGCASFRDEVPDAGAAWSRAGDNRPTVGIAIDGETSMNGRTRDMPTAGIDKWRDVTRRVYRESGLFSAVREGIDGTDLRVNIRVLNQGKGNFVLAFISGFTFFLVPAKAEDVMIVDATFRDRDGETLGSVQRRTSMDTWFHLFMIPLMPFKFPFAEIGQAMYDVQKSVLIDANRRGLLEPVSADGGG